MAAGLAEIEGEIVIINSFGETVTYKYKKVGGQVTIFHNGTPTSIAAIKLDGQQIIDVAKFLLDLDSVKVAP